MKLRNLLLLFLWFPCCAFAGDARKVESIKKVLEITNARAVLEGMRAQNVALVHTLVSQQGGPNANHPFNLRLVKRVMEKYDASSREQFAWDRWEKEYIAMYDEFFSQPELDGLLEFYRSDAGKAMIRAAPIFGARIQKKVFDENSEADAQIDRMIKDTISEIQEELVKEGDPIRMQAAPASESLPRSKP